MKIYQNHICTPNSIVLMFNEGNPVSISNTNSSYTNIINLIKNGQYEKIPSEADLATKIEVHTNNSFTVKDNEVYISVSNKIQEKLPQAIADVLIKFVANGVNTDPLIKFWKRLKRNPSEISKNALFAFIQANHVPITNDGMLICHKNVRQDFKDWYTRTFNNSVGKTIKMVRNEVTEDVHLSCAPGLHVANYDFAKNYRKDGKLLQVLVDPADVVSVPSNNLNKMRVCKYKVLSETQKETKDLVIKNPNQQTVMPSPIGDDMRQSEPKAEKITKARSAILKTDGKGGLKIKHPSLRGNIKIYKTDARSKFLLLTNVASRGKLLAEIISANGTIRIPLKCFRDANLKSIFWKVKDGKNGLEVRL